MMTWWMEAANGLRAISKNGKKYHLCKYSIKYRYFISKTGHFLYNFDTIPPDCATERGTGMIEVKIRARMGELNMNQTQLAEKTGLRANTISDLYHDFADRISLDHLDRICEALNCSLPDILVYTPKVKKERLKRYARKPK